VAKPVCGKYKVGLRIRLAAVAFGGRRSEFIKCKITNELFFKCCRTVASRTKRGGWYVKEI
jgi:hypothetical protein